MLPGLIPQFFSTLRNQMRDILFRSSRVIAQLQVADESDDSDDPDSGGIKVRMQIGNAALQPQAERFNGTAYA